MIEVDAANRGVRLYNGMKIDRENGSNGLVGREGNAEEGTRTPTAFRPPAPKAGASANSATSALPDSITEDGCRVVQASKFGSGSGSLSPSRANQT
jgi:hypothetical protein